MIKFIPFVVKFYVFPKCLKSFKQHNQSTEEFCLSFPPPQTFPHTISCDQIFSQQLTSSAH